MYVVFILQLPFTVLLVTLLSLDISGNRLCGYTADTFEIISIRTEIIKTK